ncbi:hypothetical protein Pcinc_015356 [Petrolisthes cinctipes]|uniref:Uncharacterized protein n=1 Tax=Petrolisthes cinctipes TaxID=88211 RepID=A0AAE1FT76_PETCI|nr:hypothetical protein Pcinc_015356 [Petrolisthes cinctipes]
MVETAGGNGGEGGHGGAAATRHPAGPVSAYLSGGVSKSGEGNIDEPPLQLESTGPTRPEQATQPQAAHPSVQPPPRATNTFL